MMTKRVAIFVHEKREKIDFFAKFGVTKKQKWFKTKRGCGQKTCCKGVFEPPRGGEHEYHGFRPKFSQKPEIWKNGQNPTSVLFF